MRLMYANAEYRSDDTRGRNAHIGQFIHQAVALGHEIWAWPGNEHPEVRVLPRNRMARWLKMIHMDVLYILHHGIAAHPRRRNRPVTTHANQHGANYLLARPGLFRTCGQPGISVLPLKHALLHRFSRIQ